MEGNILIVDDDSIIIKSCDSILSSEGYTVTGATSAREGMDQLKNNTIDIVITDLKMPEIDGMEFIQWIKKENLPVGIVVITGYPSQETINDALELGIIDYLPKPFSPALLREVTAKALSFISTAPGATEKKEDDALQAEEFKGIIETHRDRPGALIPVLQQVQERIGYLPPSIQRFISRGLNIPVSEVHSIVSFYSFFTMKPKGKHGIKVCRGTACYVKRANEIIHQIQEHLGIEEGEMTEDRLYSLESVRCIGACGLAPVVVIDHDIHGDVDPLRVAELMDEYK